MAKVTDEEYERSLAESRQLVAEIEAMGNASQTSSDDDYLLAQVAPKDEDYYPTAQVASVPKDNLRNRLLIPMPEIEGEATNKLVSTQQQSLLKDAPPYFDAQEVQPFSTEENAPGFRAHTRPGFTPAYEVPEIDPRTNLPIGAVPEEQITKEMIESMAEQMSVYDQTASGKWTEILAKTDPKYSQHYPNILQVMKVHYQYISEMMEAQRMMYAVKGPDDIEGIDAAVVARDKAMTTRQKMPLEYPMNGIVHETFRAMAEMGASWTDIIADAGPGAAAVIGAGAVAGGLAGGLAGNPGAGAMYGAKLATKYGVPIKMFESMQRQGTGELMLNMMRPTNSKQEPIPYEIARSVSEKYAVPYAVLETGGKIAEVVAGFGFTASIAKRIVALASEGGTEWGQTIVQDIGLWAAQKELARIKGVPYTVKIQDVLDYHEARSAARQAMLGTGGVAITTSPVSVPIATRRIMADVKQRKAIDQIKADLKALSKANKKIIDDNAGKPIDDVIDDTTNTLVKGVPIDPAEINEIKGDNTVKGTDISDGDIDDLVIVDDADIDDALDNFDNKVDESYDDVTAAFFTGLRDHFQDDEQVNLIEELLTARAQSADMSLSQYMEKRGLTFEKIDVDSSMVGAYTYIGQEGNTIISAFNNADMVDVISELGQVFRLDLNDEQHAIVDQFVGVDVGAEWDGAANETFARGWEQYIATGQAPSQELKSLFQKLSSWIVQIYRTIRGKDIPNLNIPPEMVAIFDSMLVKKKVIDINTKSIDDSDVNNPLNVPTIVEPPEIDDTEIEIDEFPTLNDPDDIVEPPEEPPEIGEDDIEIEDDEPPEIGEDDIVIEDDKPVAKSQPKKPKAKKTKAKKIVPRMRVVDGGIFEIPYHVPNAVNEQNYVPKGMRGDRDILDDIKGDTHSAADVARWYIKYGDQEQQVVAKRIVGLLEEVPYTVVELNTYYPHGIHRVTAEGYGVYLPDAINQRGGVYVRGKSWGADAANNETPLHELVHAATVLRLDEADRLIRDGVSNTLTKNYQALQLLLVQINAHVRTEINAGIASGNHPLSPGFPVSGFERVEELVAYGMTKKVFQDYLATIDMRIIDAKGKSRPIKALTKFIRTIRAILGMPASEHTALVRVMQFGEVFMRTQKEQKAKQKGTAPMYDSAATNTLVEATKTRKEPTSNAAVERIRREREARERAILAYETVIANQIKKGTTEVVARRIQKKAMLKAMKSMFDAGDLHGYAVARDHFKAIISRERIRLANVKKHKALRTSIISKLERGMPAKIHGKLYVKISPEVSKLFRDVLKVLHPLTTDAKIRNAYDERLGGVFDIYAMAKTDTDYIINTFLDGAVSRNAAGVKILEQLNAALSAILSGESKLSPMMKKVAQVKALKPGIINDINGGHVVDSPLSDTKMLHAKRRQQKTWNETLKTWTIGHKNIFGLTGLLKLATIYSPGAQSTLSKMGNFYQAKQAKATRVREQQAFVMAMYEQAFELSENKTKYALFSKWKEDTKPTYELVGVEMSKTQIRQLWMYMQDPTLTNRLVMQFSDPAIRARITKESTEEELLDIMEDMAISYNEVVNAVESYMSDQDRAFARLLMEHFNSDEQYEYVNTVHKTVAGIELGRIEGYVPIRAANFLDPIEQLDRAQIVSQFKHDDYIRKTPQSAKSIRERAKNADRYQIRLDGDITLFNSYTEEMAHYVSFAEQAQLFMIAIEDTDIRRAIEVEYGGAFYSSITHAAEDVLADGIHTRTQYPLMDKFRATFVRSTIGMSTSVFLKQHISTVQYMQHMPVLDFALGMGKFWLKPIEHFKEMMATEFIKNRSSSIDRDMKQSRGSSEYKKWKLNPTISNLIALNVTLGDASAIIQGAWVYKEYLKTQVNPATGVRYTNKEALNLAFEKSSQTQQSGDMQELSATQRGGSFAQLATMYSTGPVQAVRQEIEAIRDLIAGKITPMQCFKTFFIYHALVPSLFAMASGLISGRDEEDWITAQLIAAALGPFSSMYTIGEVLDAAVQEFAGLKVYPVEGVLSDAVQGVKRLVRDFGKGEDLSIEDWSQATQSVLILTGHGIPVTRMTRTVQNLAEGNVKGALLQQRVEE